MIHTIQYTTAHTHIYIYTYIHICMYVCSKGTPLGPTLANFYASYVENKVFDSNPSLKPRVYCRYTLMTHLLL